MGALPAVIPAVTESLYHRLGGAAGVAAIVDDAVDRHAANPVLAPRFRGQDLPRLKSVDVTYLVAGSGGPPLHATPATPTVQTEMRFSEDEVDAVIADVAAAMVEQGAAAAEVSEVIRLYRWHKHRVTRLASLPRCAANPVLAWGTIEEQVLHNLRVGGFNRGSANPIWRVTT
jgi:hemoglobin